MLEGQLEVTLIKKEVEQTTSVFQSSHNTPLTLLGHSYCMLEGQLEVHIMNEEVGQITSVYQSSHNTPLTLLRYRLDEHTYMELSIRLEVLTRRTVDHFILFLNIMFHVQCATLQHEDLF